MMLWLALLFSGMGLLASRAASAAGSVDLDAWQFQVQDKVSFRWIYTVDGDGFAVGDSLVLDDPVFHGKRWSKWGDLSPYAELCTEGTTAQRASWGLLSAQVQRAGVVLDDITVAVERSNCQVDADDVPTCRADIHEETTTTLYLEGATDLNEGDEIHLLVGDVDGCTAACEAAGEGDCSYCAHCGFEMPDRSFPEIAWPTAFCPSDAACEPLDPPILSVASADPAALLVTAPSQVVAGEAFALKVAVLDTRGNPVASDGLTLSPTLGALTGTMDEGRALTAADGGWHDFRVVLDDPGVARLSVAASDGSELTLSGTSNPIEVLETLPAVRVFWGDIHVHHGFTYTDSDGLRRDLNHDYARDVVGLDIVAESQKATGIEIDEEALWAELQDNCGTFSTGASDGAVQDAGFLVLLAFEWMGDSAAAENGTETVGHHNVYYNGCEAPLGTHDVDQIDSLDGERGLWQWVEAVRETYDVDAVTVPHAMRYTGYAIAQSELQTLAEIYSEWGDNSRYADGEVEGSNVDLLAHGLRVGFIGASDNHDGWMGNPYSKKNVTSGLGAFIAPSLDRQDVFEAMQARRGYATTGHRALLFFQVDEAGATFHQGSEVVARSPTLRWRVHGTDTLREVLLHRVDVGGEIGRETVVSERPGVLDLDEVSLALDWEGEATAAFWVEAVQDDGERAWSSPIWLTGDCARVAHGAQDPGALCGQDTGDTADDSGEDGADTADTSGDTSVDTSQTLTDQAPGLRCGCGSGGGRVGWALAALLLLRRRDTSTSRT